MRARIAMGFLVGLPAAALAQDSLKFTAVTAGGWHTCAITTAGAAYCWGYGRFGQLGNGDTGIQTVPAPVAGGLRFTTVSAGRFHTCGLTTDSTAYCWGSNGWGQLGSESAADGCTNREGKDKQALACSLRPRAVAGGRHFATLSVNGLHACATAGGSHSCAIAVDTTAYCWGEFEHGRLGIGESFAERLKGKSHQMTLAAVDGAIKYRSLSAGGVHTCGVATSGEAYCWGDNLEGRLGTGGSSFTRRSWNTKPSPPKGDLRLTMISAGDYHSCGVTTDGAVYCWGSNKEGQLGNGTTKGKSEPVRVGATPAMAADTSRH